MAADFHFVSTANSQTPVQQKQQQILLHQVMISTFLIEKEMVDIKLIHLPVDVTNLISCPFSGRSNSDDNMLKNIELFDKLSLRFNNRVLFIKDVIGDEICCWSFYGQGRKIAEVCCTSIVYATEKKQTKVTC